MSNRGSFRHTFRALRHRNFRAFYTGNAISVVGTWMQMTATGWLVWKLTESAAALGWIAFISRIPGLFISPFAGVLADRTSRHRLVIICQTMMMVQALALAALTLSGAITFSSLAALSFILGVLSSFDMPARQSFVIELVGKEDLPNAIPLNAGLFNVARIIGPSIAGLIIGALSSIQRLDRLPYFPEGLCFLINGLSYAAVIYFLCGMKIKPRPIETSAGNLASHLGEALRFARAHAAVRDPLLYMAVIGSMGYTHSVLLPAVASDVLGLGAGGYGSLLAATGVGAVIGALVLARGFDRLGYDRVICLAGISLGLGLLLFSSSRLYLLSVVLLLPTGATMMIQSASTNTLLQHLVPDRMRGRIMSFYTAVFLGMFPVGSLILGLIAERTDPLVAIRVGGLGCLTGGVMLSIRLPAIRASIEKLQD